MKKITCITLGCALLATCANLCALTEKEAKQLGQLRAQLATQQKNPDLKALVTLERQVQRLFEQTYSDEVVNLLQQVQALELGLERSEAQEVEQQTARHFSDKELEGLLQIIVHLPNKEAIEQLDELSAESWDDALALARVSLAHPVFLKIVANLPDPKAQIQLRNAAMAALGIFGMRIQELARQGKLKTKAPYGASKPRE